MKLIAILLLISSITMCSPSIPMDDSLLMNEKLQNTEWKTEGLTRKASILFYTNEITFKLGSVLGVANTPISLLDQDLHYILYNIYESDFPELLGVVQIDEKTIKLLVWRQSSTMPLKEDIINIISNKGEIFKLQKIND